ncbi:hypothetical protein CR152_01865 [Massilia violaceinigra]|uniref:IS66 family insertion sequence element accessory protein TnpB n=1 Tax=Massilia violaceinigra TaxID=2045208 RepID=A0A2D2DEJ1_9BURK|nr:hypothetical protein [Massilia violaceinigra]ATQ73393.1 hypothetical protein CR152_01865 [Massilia violaceinigra]
MHEPTKHERWPARLQAQAESGQTIRAWCSFNGVTEASVHYWRKRLATTGAPASPFIALPDPTRSATILEVETPVRLGSPAHMEWLGAVLAVLR